MISRCLSSFTQRLLFLALPLAISLVFLFPATSEAHAILLRSDPPKDTVLNTAPSQVRMWFSEDLNPAISTAFVVNSSNQHVEVNGSLVLPTDAREMDVSLRPDLAPGVYVVVWRTQSAADGHVLSGSFLFSVAAADGTVPKLNGTLPAQSAFGNTASGSTTGQLDGPTLFSFIMVTLVELGTIFWVGAQLWHTFVLQLTDAEDSEQSTIEQHMEERFERRFSLPILRVLLLANVGVLLGQALSITGGRWDQIFAPTLLAGLLMNGRFGTFWLMRIIVIVLAMVLTAYGLLSRRHPAIVDNALPWAKLMLALALLIALTLSGHAAATTGNVATYAVLVDWLHLLAASLWVGGMMYISAIYLPVLRDRSWLERARSLLTTIPHFSPLAIAGVLIMSITGPFNATVHMSSLDQLYTTTYGRALVVKALLVGALLLTSAIHVCILRPRLAKEYKKNQESIAAAQAIETTEAGDTPNITSQAKQLEISVSRQTSTLSQVLRWEPLLGIAILICTGLMNVFAGTLLPAAANQPVPQQPVGPVATAAPARPFSTTVKTTDNKFMIKLNITPNNFGPNVFTTSILDSSGKPVTNIGVSLYTTMLDMDMGTDTVNLQPDGKGSFTARGDLSMPGNWQIRIQIRTPENTLHEAKVKLFTPA